MARVEREQAGERRGGVGLALEVGQAEATLFPQLHVLSVVERSGRGGGVERDQRAVDVEGGDGGDAGRQLARGRPLLLADRAGPDLAVTTSGPQRRRRSDAAAGAAGGAGEDDQHQAAPLHHRHGSRPDAENAEPGGRTATRFELHDAR